VKPSGSLVWLAALGLAGCGVTADDCNPERSLGLITSSICALGGGYEERSRRLTAEIEAKVAAYRLSQEEVLRLDAEAARLASDRIAWEQRLVAMDKDAAAMEQELARLRAARARDRTALAALQNEAGQLRGELQQARQGDGTAEAEIRRLTVEVERRRQAIRDILRGMASE
jgi:predicted  nucleic acid-binding Zn-ribbon protein